MQRIKKRFATGIHTISLPIGMPTSINTLFPKELSGSTIEKLDSNGQWMQKETVSYLNHSFSVSNLYKEFLPLDIVRLDLKRDIIIEWDIDFKSHSGLNQHTVEFELGFDFEEALYLAQLSKLVYNDEQHIYETMKTNYQFDDFFYYSKQSHKRLFRNALNKLLLTFFRGRKSIVDLQFMYLSKKNETNGKNVVAVVFQGSQEVEDWMTNFNLQDERFLDRGNVHKGFHHALKLFFKTIRKQDLTLSKPLRHSIADEIEYLNANTTIMLTGHSLGGALATLAGCYLYELGFKRENLEIYTFGAPPVGTMEFCDYYRDKIEIYRLVNENDFVPKLDNWTKFFHLGKEIMMPSNQGEIHACDGYIDNIIDCINHNKDMETNSQQENM